MEPLPFARIVLWVVAGGLAGYFGIGNARVWRSLALGFALLAASELLALTLSLSTVAPGSYALALGSVVGMNGQGDVPWV